MSTTGTRTAAPSLTLRNVKKSFGQIEIIKGIDLSVQSGEFHVVIGPNGAGKSTLFNLISGRIAPTAGHILLDDRDISGQSPRIINHLGLSRSFQITNIFPNMTVFENFRCAVLGTQGVAYNFLRPASYFRSITEKVDQLLEDVRLRHRRDDIAGNLSYAEQRALEVGMTIAGDARILLLDEPMAGMNHNEIAQFAEFLRMIARNRTVLMVEHDMGVVFSLADRISVLVYGELLASGTPEAIRTDRRVQEAYLGTEA
ncbi:ABC transporter ATP-binding protein [Castellaniella sp. WN]